MRYKWYKGTGYKKYKVELYEKGDKIKTVQFGDKRYEHYKDSTPLKLYTHLNHLDKERRKRYKIRHEKDRHVKYTAGWFADKFLW